MCKTLNVGLSLLLVGKWVDWVVQDVFNDNLFLMYCFFDDFLVKFFGQCHLIYLFNCTRGGAEY